MKKFMTPKIEIIRFAVEDILTTSGREDEDGGEWATSNFELPRV